MVGPESGHKDHIFHAMFYSNLHTKLSSLTIPDRVLIPIYRFHKALSLMQLKAAGQVFRSTAFGV